MFGQSSPFAATLGTLAGAVGGELARAAAKEMGGGEFVQRVAAGLGHSVSHAAVGWTINALGGADVTGAGITAMTSLGGGLVHAMVVEESTELIIIG